MASRRPRNHRRFTCRDAYSAGVTLALSVLVLASRRSDAGPSSAAAAGREPARYTNPVLFADYSDPDVVRLGDDFYMVSSSFHCVPGLPVLHSRDLVHWKIVSHALPSLPAPDFDLPQHGRGVWAPSIRYHSGEFWIYYGDPDRGIYLVKGSHAEGPWEPAVLVQEAVGWIDPCPLWDDDDTMYLVHAWAKSRVGFNSILTIHRMSPDGLRVLDEGTTLFDGHENQPTIEGPKLYRRDGFYYVFAPAGGVRTGWQVVLRARSVLGPYEDRVVLAQGSTSINGPHQGAWVESSVGESWFLHFQDRGPFGRVVHLQPVEWVDGWPMMGVDPDGDGIGEPVLSWRAPRLRRPPAPQAILASDEFDRPTLGLQWQWQANPRSDWASLTASPGSLRLRALPAPPGASSLWSVPHLLLQKLPGPSCRVTARLQLGHLRIGEEVGLVVLGRDYSALVCSRTADGFYLERSVCRDAQAGGTETRDRERLIGTSVICMRVSVDTSAVCRYSAGENGTEFTPVGDPAPAREGVWVGARVGVYCSATAQNADGGFAEIDWFRVEQ